MPGVYIGLEAKFPLPSLRFTRFALVLPFYVYFTFLISIFPLSFHFLLFSPTLPPFFLFPLLIFSPKWNQRHYIRRLCIGNNRQLWLFFVWLGGPSLEEFPRHIHFSLSQALASIGSYDNQTSFNFSSPFCVGPGKTLFCSNVAIFCILSHSLTMCIMSLKVVSSEN